MKERLIPEERRSWFYNLAASDKTASYDLVEARGLAANASSILSREWRYSRQAMAAIDLGLAPEGAQRLFGEAALASRFYVEADPKPGWRYVFNGFFATAVVNDEKALVGYAALVDDRLGAQKKAFEPHLDALAKALCASLSGDEKRATSLLAGAKKLPPNKRRKSHAAWFASLLDLAKVCLAGKPQDLAPLLVRVSATTKAHFVLEDIENQAFEPWLNRVALSLVAGARTRGWKLAGPNPHPSMRLDLLRLPPSKLPQHPFWKWPKPAAAHFAKVAAVLK